MFVRLPKENGYIQTNSRLYLIKNTQHVNQIKVCGVCKASVFKAASNEYYAIICNGLTNLSENLTDLTFTQVHLDPNPVMHAPDTCEPVMSTQVRTRHCVWLK